MVLMAWVWVVSSFASKLSHSFVRQAGSKLKGYKNHPMRMPCSIAVMPQSGLLQEIWQSPGILRLCWHLKQLVFIAHPKKVLTITDSAIATNKPMPHLSTAKCWFMSLISLRIDWMSLRMHQMSFSVASCPLIIPASDSCCASSKAIAIAADWSWLNPDCSRVCAYFKVLKVVAIRKTPLWLTIC